MDYIYGQLVATNTEEQNKILILNNIKTMISTYIEFHLIDNQVETYSEIDDLLIENENYDNINFEVFLTNSNNSEDNNFINQLYEYKVSDECIQKLINLRKDILDKLANVIDDIHINL